MVNPHVLFHKAPSRSPIGGGVMRPLNFELILFLPEYAVHGRWQSHQACHQAMLSKVLLYYVGALIAGLHFI